MKTQQTSSIDFAVGLFMLLGVLALIFLIFKVSGVTTLTKATYHVTADFTDIGGLKVHAPVTVSGVKVGEVSAITLQKGTLNAHVVLQLRQDQPIPYEDASARILTQGLLGANYISLVPGFDEATSDHPYLREGDHIIKTQEAMILENLIGQLLFNINKK